MMKLLNAFGDRFMTALESLPMAIEAVLNAVVLSYLWFFGSYLFYRFDPQMRREGSNLLHSHSLSPSDLHHPHVWSLLGAIVCGGGVLLVIFIDYSGHRRSLLVFKQVLIWLLLYVPLSIAYFKLPW